MTILTDEYVRSYVIVQTKRARCALYKEILDLFNEESISRACRGRDSIVYKFDEKPTARIKKK